MKAEVGSLLFKQDNTDPAKKRPYICVHVFTNAIGIPYNWLIVPITSTATVGVDNLVEVVHKKLTLKSYAKISNIESISWVSRKIEVSKLKFCSQCVRDVQEKLENIFKI